MILMYPLEVLTASFPLKNITGPQKEAGSSSKHHDFQGTFVSFRECNLNDFILAENTKTVEPVVFFAEANGNSQAKRRYFRLTGLIS